MSVIIIREVDNFFSFFLWSCFSFRLCQDVNIGITISNVTLIIYLHIIQIQVYLAGYYHTVSVRVGDDGKELECGAV